MKFGQKLKLKKDLEVGYLTIKKDTIAQIAEYHHKYGMKIHVENCSLIDFSFSWDDRTARIDEYFEIIKDPGTIPTIREIEFAIKDWYIRHEKVPVNFIGDWFQTSNLNKYKWKVFYVHDFVGDKQTKEFKNENTDELFKEVYSYYKEGVL